MIIRLSASWYAISVTLLAGCAWLFNDKTWLFNAGFCLKKRATDLAILVESHWQVQSLISIIIKHLYKWWAICYANKLFWFNIAFFSFSHIYIGHKLKHIENCISRSLLTCVFLSIFFIIQFSEFVIDWSMWLSSKALSTCTKKKTYKHFKLSSLQMLHHKHL